MTEEAKVEESEALPPQDAWLRAYLETLVYHTETFNALRELQIRVELLTKGIDLLHTDVQVILFRLRGSGLYGGNAKEQSVALSETGKTEGFEGREL